MRALSARWGPALVGAVVFVLAAAILANSLTKPIGRDEQMYCTAGALLAQGRMIYRDFSYPSQLPYHPLLLAALYRALGTTDYLLVGRLVSVLEGGYELDGLADSVAAHIRALMAEMGRSEDAK